MKLIRDDLAESTELYDLLRDPGERNDLAAERPGEVARLLARLDARLPDRSTRPGAGSVPLERELEEALRSLGYLEP